MGCVGVEGSEMGVGEMVFDREGVGGVEPIANKQHNALPAYKFWIRKIHIVRKLQF